MKIIIPPQELRWSFIRASGPGGQNVNKVSTAAQLHFDVRATTLLTAAAKQRLYDMAGNRINKLGQLVITACTQRTQEANRAEALERLIKFLKRAAIVPKKRVKTKPSRAAVTRGKNAKKLHSQKKQQRSPKLDSH